MNTIIIVSIVVVVLFGGSYILSSIQKKMREEELNSNLNPTSTKVEEKEEDDDKNNENGEDKKNVEKSGSGFGCLLGTLLLVGILIWGGFNLCLEDDPYERNMMETTSVEHIEKPMYQKTVYSDGTERLQSYKIIYQGVNNDKHFVVIQKTLDDGTSKLDTLYRQLSVETDWTSVD